jgi:transposase InsO family protein
MKTIRIDLTHLRNEEWFELKTQFILKSELLYLQEFESMEQFVEKLKEYIDYYNNNRIKLKLKGMSPVQFRTHLTSITKY